MPLGLTMLGHWSNMLTKCQQIRGNAHHPPVSHPPPSISSHVHQAHQTPFYPKQKSSKHLMKKVMWGSHLPPCTSDCRPYCQVLELLKVGGGQGQGQTIGKTHPLNLRPHSLALYHHGGSTGTLGKRESRFLGLMLSHPSRVNASMWVL